VEAGQRIDWWYEPVNWCQPMMFTRLPRSKTCTWAEALSRRPLSVRAAM
jgi:hypothetical protein